MRISVEGNIGCGKSTLIKNLSSMDAFHDVRTVLEPIEEWQSWLTEMYNDPHRWSFAFNMKVMLSLSEWKKWDSQDCIFERSPLACRHVFCKVQHERAELSDKEMALLVEAHGALGWEPDVVIYLRASPRVCEMHMRARGRLSEANVSQEYLKQVHDKYDALFLLESANYRVIVVDVDDVTPSELASIVADEIKACIGV